MTSTTSDPAHAPETRVDLLDRRLFAEDRFHPMLERLREESPVHRHPGQGDEPGFWALTRYDDVVAAYRDAAGLSSAYGMRLGSNADAVAAVTSRMLIVSDAPHHTQLKRVFSRFFTADGARRLHRLVETVVRDLLDSAVKDGQTEFVETAKRLPNHVICSMMGLPRSDWDWVCEVTTAAFEGETERARSVAHSQIFLYLHDVLLQRRARPGDDLISAVASATRMTDDGERELTGEEIVFNANGILAGANETTRYTSAGTALALARDAEQWRLLRERGEAVLDTAVEEALRWTSPGVHALRTVTRPTTIRDVELTPGDRVTLWNASANRDHRVFTDPHRFRVDRSPNRHVAFGSGPHLCLGARLARLELRVLLGELARRAERLELLGDPVYNDSNFTWGLRSLPLRVVPSAGGRAD